MWRCIDILMDRWCMWPLAGSRERVRSSWCRRPELGEVSIPVALHKWTVGDNLHFWASVHCLEEQDGEILAIWNRFMSYEDAFRSRSLNRSKLTNHSCGCCFSLGSLRSFIADYGVPLMVITWTALSFSVPSKVVSGVPRRLFSPLPWESASSHHWTVIKVISQFLLRWLFSSLFLDSRNQRKEKSSYNFRTWGGSRLSTSSPPSFLLSWSPGSTSLIIV